MNNVTREPARAAGMRSCGAWHCTSQSSVREQMNADWPGINIGCKLKEDFNPQSTDVMRLPEIAQDLI